MRSLTSKYPAKQDREHEVRICELTKKEKQATPKEAFVFLALDIDIVERRFILNEESPDYWCRPGRSYCSL